VSLNYFGVDWLEMVLTLCAIYLLGDKEPVGVPGDDRQNYVLGCRRVPLLKPRDDDCECSLPRDEISRTDPSRRLRTPESTDLGNGITKRAAGSVAGAFRDEKDRHGQ